MHSGNAKNAKNFIIHCWYRPPTNDLDTESFNAFEGILSKLDSEDKEVIIIGDTNCDFMSHKNSNTKRLKSLYDLFHFKQQTRDYTRIASQINKDCITIVTKSLIDHLATNREKYILKTEIIKSGMVDHYLTIGTGKVNAWRIKQRSENIKETRSMNKYNKLTFYRVWLLSIGCNILKPTF